MHSILSNNKFGVHCLKCHRNDNCSSEKKLRIFFKNLFCNEKMYNNTIILITCLFIFGLFSVLLINKHNMPTIVFYAKITFIVIY